jgi:D-3-phosphoglycerate dehydrogenase
MGFKVAITTPADLPGLPHYGEEDYRKIGAELVKKLCRSEDDLISIAHDADAIITGGEPYSRRVIEKLTKCRVISNIGIGYDGIDVEAATEHGIYVTNVPDYCLEEMAEHTLALILACGRKLLRFDRAVREGKWDSRAPREIREKIRPPMFRLKGQTLGLVGLGRIPRTLVPKAKALGLKVIAYDPYVSKDAAAELGVEMVGFEQLLRESDFVSLHAALTKDNQHMIGAEQLKKMKRTAYLINTARGGLVDEQALNTALSEGIIAGAGLDVLDPEPPRPDNPLFKRDNVIITAHSANYSEESQAELLRRPEEEVFSILRGESPRCPVNPQVKERFVTRWGKIR